ncbi:glycosyl hydrolase, partial [Alicyclobacillus fodiniaquatilis]
MRNSVNHLKESNVLIVTPKRVREGEDMGNMYQQFTNPNSEYRGKPFWSWNGKLDKEELIRQIYVMKEMGFGGFFMHSRTGLVTEYLGDEWFELINACADEAEKLGMEAWLYDEDRWPSGTAGGMVTQTPEYRLKFIRLRVVAARDFEWSENLIAAFSCRLDGLNYEQCEQLDSKVSFVAREGFSVLCFSVEEMKKESFYNGYTYLDTMNAEATARFLELTHEKYKAYCGDRLGKSIKGIFTDEPHRGALFDGFGIHNEDAQWLAPWTYSLFADFTGKYGYDLVAKLPELFLRPGGQVVSQVKWHYVELLQELFLNNYAKPLNAWCEENNLVLTGHILHEDSLTAQVAMSGSVMRYYEHMGHPGVDVLSEGNKNFWIVKQLSSAARQLGKRWLLSELYGCTGWQMSFESHKAVGDWQALFGINLRCHHLSWYTMEGEAKRDFPASILHQSTWWQDYDYVETYFSRLGYMMMQGKPVCDVLVINPVESVWCQVYPGWSKGLSTTSSAIQALEETYQKMFHILAGSQIDFDYGDEDMIHRLHRIEIDEIGRPILWVGEANYKVVVIAGVTTIRLTTLQVLQKFAKLGGQVVFVGDVPTYVDALASDEAKHFAATVVTVPFEMEAVVAACTTQGAPSVRVIDAGTGETIQDIYSQVRVYENRHIVLLMNVNREHGYQNARIQFPLVNGGFVEEWDCVNGTKKRMLSEHLEDIVEVCVDFPPTGEHLFVQLTEQEDGIFEETQSEVEVIGEFEGSYNYRLSEPNVCVLDIARYRVDAGEWQTQKEILKVDREIREHFGMKPRGGEMIQPWYAKTEWPKCKCQLTLAFDFEIDKLPSSDVEVVLEAPELFQVEINGHGIDTSNPRGWWIDRCFKRISVSTDILQVGTNTVQLSVSFHDAVNLEAIYLLGEFGVQIDRARKIITGLPEKLEIGDVTGQGLPFYSGVITYILEPGMVPDQSENVLLAFSEFEAAYIKVHSQQSGGKMIAWQPYEIDITEEIRNGWPIEVDVVLTRRNTFGPLHMVPVYAGVRLKVWTQRIKNVKISKLIRGVYDDKTIRCRFQ